MTKHLLVIALLVVGSFAQADRGMRPPKPASVVGRVVGLEIIEEGTAIVTVAAGSEQTIGKTWHARFRDGNTTKLLAGGDAIIIRIDRQTSVLKTTLSADQVRANRYIQFDP